MRPAHRGVNLSSDVESTPPFNWVRQNREGRAESQVSYPHQGRVLRLLMGARKTRLMAK